MVARRFHKLIQLARALQGGDAAASARLQQYVDETFKDTDHELFDSPHIYYPPSADGEDALCIAAACFVSGDWHRLEFSVIGKENGFTMVVAAGREFKHEEVLPAVDILIAVLGDPA